MSALGAARAGASKDRLKILTEGTINLVGAMERAGLSRVLAVAGAGILQHDATTLLRDTPDYPPSPFLRAISGAHLEAWRSYQASALEWTLLCPPAAIEPGARTERYRIQADAIVQGRYAGRISMEDAAHFLLDELEQARFVRRRVTISYRPDNATESRQA